LALPLANFFSFRGSALSSFMLWKVFFFFFLFFSLYSFFSSFLICFSTRLSCYTSFGSCLFRGKLLSLAIAFELLLFTARVLRLNRFPNAVLRSSYSLVGPGSLNLTFVSHLSLGAAACSFISASKSCLTLLASSIRIDSYFLRMSSCLRRYTSGLIRC
jgi:hypothetical protein